MPKLSPIHALRYPGADLTTKIAPPYDVLDEGPKRDLLARDPHNIVAIDLPVTPPKTVGPDEAYESAGRAFRRWLADGVLRRDPQPALFAYEQESRGASGAVTRRGIFANLAVEDFNRPNGGIFRHEHTIKGGTDDRLKLMRATAAQLSPVFGVYEDPGYTVRAATAPVFKHPPDATGLTSDDGVTHRLWAIRDPLSIDTVRRVFESTNVFIADGHHRYTTALNYRREHPDNPAAAQCLFLLVAADDPGLRILATHRILHGLQNYDFARLQSVLASDGRFDLIPVSGVDLTHSQKLIDRMSGMDRFAIALYDPAQQTSHILTTKDEDPLKTLMPHQPPIWRRLDVAILHELVLDRLIRPAFGGPATAYKYYGILNDFIAACRQGPDRLGILMRPTPLQSVLDVSLAGGVMPPKSTFFFPKVATGLVINPLG